MRTHLLLVTLALAALQTVLAAPIVNPEENWPFEIQDPHAKVVVYQPQVESFTNAMVTARAAVSVTPEGKTEPVFGAVWLTARADTDRDTRMVCFSDVAVPDMKFANATDDQKQQLAKLISDALDKRAICISQDRLLAMLHHAQTDPRKEDPLGTAAPAIVFATNPTVLVLLDGPPKLMRIPSSTLMRVVNSPEFIALDTSNKTYYLQVKDCWMTATDPLGPWSAVSAVPAEVAAVAHGSGLPSPPPHPVLAAPRVIVATEPTQLIQIEGEPEYGTVPNGDLLYVENTESDVFLDLENQHVYVLISGRWFKAPEPKGPWSYVPSDQLPAGFGRLPDSSPKADVRAQVAGTPQAREAMLDASIPQTAAIPRGQTNLGVVFDGEPKFEAITGTVMHYAVNTPNSVIRIEHSYYCCLDGVWYVTDKLITAAEGTVEGVLSTLGQTVWSVCAAVPRIVEAIPPECPVYPVKYVYVYDSTPEVVYVGYTPGYLGCFVYGGCVVYGTGYRYAPWYGAIYCPRPVTFGVAVRYNPHTGNWGVAWGVRGPYGGFAFGYHSSWGWGPVAGGFYAGGGWHSTHYNNITINNNVYRHNLAPGRGPGSINHPGQGRDQGANRITERRPETRPVAPTPADHARALAGNRPAAAPVAKRNDVLADRDGNVYRRNLDGWQRHDSSGWTKPATSTAVPRQTAQSLNNDFAARARGTERTESFRSSPSSFGGFGSGGGFNRQGSFGVGRGRR